ncbi:Clavaminate synthase-like protein [Meredithblackwellia eburnea MCA 4105]
MGVQNGLGSVVERELPVELQTILDRVILTNQDLKPCGPSAFALFTRSLFHLQQRDTRTSISLCTSLLNLCNSKINSYNYKDVPVYWRRMYIDCTIVKVLGVLGEGEERVRERMEQAVKDLDMALIVSGAPGEGRREIIFQLIKTAQHHLLPLLPPRSQSQTDSSPRPAKRPRLLPPLSSPYIHHPLPTIPSHPSFESFPTLSKSPFIIKSGCCHWPASTHWHSFEYLSRIAGPGRVVPVEVGRNYTDENWGQRIVGFDEFLDSLRGHGLREEGEEGEGEMYLAQHDLFRQFPELLDGVLVPDLVYLSPSGEEEEDYQGPNTEEGYSLNAWFGPKGTVSPAHTDPFYNCYAQVVGTKWIWVAPPSVGPFMSTYGLPASPSSQTNEQGESTSSMYMTNTARIDVTDPSQFRRFPEFEREVVPVAMQAVLEEGDLLYMPPGWWHSMKSLEVSFSVSIWF